MKIWKKAAFAIVAIFLLCVFWYAVTSKDVQGTVGEGPLAASPQEPMERGIVAENLQKSLGNKLTVSKLQEDSSARYEAGGRSIAAEEDREVSANVQEVLGVADIQEMEAGSLLDMSAVEADLPESLFYIEELSPEVQQRIMGISYQENDNIALGELRYLRILHIGFDGQTHIGELLVNQSIAADVLEIMQELYENGYAIEKMTLVDNYGADDEQSMEDNNTSAFNYREIAGSSKLSRHSLGLAIDINPLYNPCVKNGGTLVSPVNGVAYADRSQQFAHKIDENDLCYKLFTEHGFTWGGNWNSLKDYQHFEK